MTNEERKAKHLAAVVEELRNSTVLPLPDEAVASLRNTIEALEKLSAFVNSLDYKTYRYCEVCERTGLDPESASKTALNMAKMVSDLSRLFEFAKGKPDSRTEVTGIADLMKLLTNEQFTTLTGWLEQADAPTQRPH